jgi:hypothetical protein
MPARGPGDTAEFFSPAKGFRLCYARLEAFVDGVLPPPNQRTIRAAESGLPPFVWQLAFWVEKNGRPELVQQQPLHVQLVPRLPWCLSFHDVGGRARIEEWEWQRKQQGARSQVATA